MPDGSATSAVVPATSELVTTGDGGGGDALVEECEPADDSLVLADLLIEDVSIDGMCGVY